MTTDIVTEERVSFETAKLLDEKRWAIACHAAYFLTDLAQMTSAAVLMKKQMIGQ